MRFLRSTFLLVVILTAGTVLVTPQQQTIAVRASLGSAMTLLYGNYNNDSKTSLWDNPVIPSMMKDSTGTLESHQPAVVHVLLDQDISESGKRKHVLLTWAGPEDQTQVIHPSKVLIGGAVFLDEGDNWRLEAENKTIVWDGSFGQPGQASLVRIGRDRYGIRLEDGFYINGEDNESAHILIAWNATIVNALSLETVADNLGSICGERGHGPCYHDELKVDFVPGRNPEYFDIITQWIGSQATGGRPTKHSQRIQRFTFHNGKYIQDQYPSTVEQPQAALIDPGTRQGHALLPGFISEIL